MEIFSGQIFKSFAKALAKVGRVSGGDVMCCHVMWYDVMCLVPR